MKYVKEYGTKSRRTIGRPKVDVDFEIVEECAAKGMSLREIAKLLGYSYSNLHRKVRSKVHFLDN